MFTNTACQIRLESLPGSRIFPTAKETFTSCEMNTDIHFFCLSNILKKRSWADLVAALHRKDDLCLGPDPLTVRTCRSRALPGRAVVQMASWLQLDYRERCVTRSRFSD